MLDSYHSFPWERLQHRLIWTMAIKSVWWDVWLPLRMNSKIICHQLMSEKQHLVAPFWRCHGAIKLKSSDQRFGSTELCRLVQSVNIIEIWVCSDALELVNVSQSVSRKFTWEKGIHIRMWRKSQFEWELTTISPIWETYILDAICDWFKFTC